MAEPLVSVIIPSFNAEATIQDTVNSVLNQSYKNIEVIIVDDHSTDKTTEIIKEISKSNSKVQSHVLKENFGGPAKPRNLGIERSKGEYLAFLDADDIWHPDKLKIQLDYMNSNGAIISCSTRENFHETSELQTFPEYSSSNSKVFSYVQLLQKNWTNTSSMMLKKEFLGTLRFSTDKSLVAVEDFHLWCRFLKKNDTLMHIINDKLLYYRLLDTSISRNKVKMISKFYLVNREFNSIFKSSLNTLIYIFKSVVKVRN
jgi:teichuronic acid biosynthesis glycosyltransferase TuaG